MRLKESIQSTSPPRRRFVQGLIAGGILAAFPGIIHAASALAATITGNVPELSGKIIELVIDESPVNFTGVVRMATTINGSIPAPTLRLKEGDDVTIKVTNNLSVPSSIHWHGIILPYQTVFFNEENYKPVSELCQFIIYYGVERYFDFHFVLDYFNQ